jgi:TRAP-type C4-dicarboxylate transport system substrate-binding protein
MKPVELSYSTFFPSIHKASLVATEWCKEVEKRTNGGVKVTIYWSETLTPAFKSYDSAVTGISDIAWSAPSYSRGRFPLTEAIDLPIGAKSSRVASTLTRMCNEYYKKFKPKELDDVKVMYFFSPAGAFLHTKKPVYKLEDVKGMKIRTSGLMTKIVTALGGAPVAMGMGDVYDAISRGVAEGSWAPMEPLQNWKLGEVLHYSTESYRASNASSMFMIMNKDKWNALTPDTQKIIEKINEEWVDKMGRAWDEIEIDARAYLLKLGHNFIPLSKEEDERWGKAVRPLLDDYVKMAKAKGLPGEEALKFCLDYLEKH